VKYSSSKQPTKKCYSWDYTKTLQIKGLRQSNKRLVNILSKSHDSSLNVTLKGKFMIDARVLEVTSFYMKTLDRSG
jgi:hypothetical protein